MTKAELKQHIAQHRGSGTYLLRIEGEGASSVINIADRKRALAAFARARASGLAHRLQLFHFPTDQPEVLVRHYRAQAEATDDQRADEATSHQATLPLPDSPLSVPSV